MLVFFIRSLELYFFQYMLAIIVQIIRTPNLMSPKFILIKNFKKI